MDNQQINKIAEYQLRPNIVDKVSNSLIFYGFPLPTCKSEDDEKWLIQIVSKDENGVERTGFVDGKRSFNHAWSDRYDLTYKMGENFTENIEFVSPNE